MNLKREGMVLIVWGFEEEGMLLDVSVPLPP